MASMRVFTHATAKTQHTFKLKNSDAICSIKLTKNLDDIDQDAARFILVEAFIGEYEKYLAPQDIGKNLNSWREGDASVQKYYENYFSTEFHDFAKGDLHYWVAAKIEGKLVGWATFQREKSDLNSVYMNLLVVHPDYQHKGIGEQLVMSLMNLGEIKNLNSIHLLLRTKNKGGRTFYSKIGFYTDPEYKRDDNFVPLNLLESLTWKNPALLEEIVKNSMSMS